MALKKLRLCYRFSYDYTEDMEATLKPKTLDQLDQRILQELQQHARITNAEIGRRVGLSAPAVGERIQKLEQSGVIAGYRTVIDAEKIGLSIQAFISFRSMTLKHHDMLKLIDTIPEISEWYTITGNHCLLVKVTVATSRQLESIIELLGQYGDTTTSLILSGRANAKPIFVPAVRQG